MTDQAARLRRMAREASTLRSTVEWGTPTLVIGSGKGGVGKSIVSTMMAVEFARSGFNTLLLDGDFNLGNLHILLNVQPIARLETVLNGDTTPNDLVVRIDENLCLLPNDSGGELLHGLGSVDKARLYQRLTSVADGFDILVVDAGAGIESMIRCTAAASSYPIVVTVPEPAALADAYAVIKIINLQVSGTDVAVIVNRVDGSAQGQAAFNRLTTASQRFLHTNLHYLGAIAEDESLRAAVRDAQPFWHETNGQSPAFQSLVVQTRAVCGLEDSLSVAGADAP